MNFRKKVRSFLEYAAVRLTAFLLCCLPRPLKQLMGRMLGSIAFHAFFLAGRRRILFDNLKAAYPEEDEKSLRDTGKRCFQHLGRLLIEVLSQKPDVRTIISSVEIEGWGYLQQVALTGKGYFLASGHFGNWELVAHLQAALGYPLLMVTRPLDNPRLEIYFAGKRENTGNVVVHKRDAVRVMARGLRNGEGIAFLVDQHYGEKGKVLVPFFGRKAATTPVMGRLAADLDVPVLPVFAFPLEGGRYKIVYGPPIYAPSSRDRKADGLAVTVEMTHRLEEAVRKQREAWWWVHRRWREEAEG